MVSLYSSLCFYTFENFYNIVLKWWGGSPPIKSYLFISISGYYPILSSQGLSSQFVPFWTLKSLPLPEPPTAYEDTFYYLPFLKKERKEIWKINFNSSLGPSYLSPSTRFFCLPVQSKLLFLCIGFLNPHHPFTSQPTALWETLSGSQHPAGYQLQRTLSCLRLLPDSSQRSPPTVPSPDGLRTSVATVPPSVSAIVPASILLIALVENCSQTFICTFPTRLSAPQEKNQSILLIPVTRASSTIPGTPQRHLKIFVEWKH